MELVNGYEDWKDFFFKKLTGNNDFSLFGAKEKGDTEIEVYTSLKHHPDTYIEVGYFSAMTLIYVHILNPETPGKNREQELEYFYKYDFDKTGKAYGPPGLDFDEMNINGVSSLLSNGFFGEEVVYYKNGKAVKSDVTTEFFLDNRMNTVTYKFEEESFFAKLRRKWDGGKEVYDEIKIIDLETIFKGIK